MSTPTEQAATSALLALINDDEDAAAEALGGLSINELVYLSDHAGKLAKLAEEIYTRLAAEADLQRRITERLTEALEQQNGVEGSSPDAGSGLVARPGEPNVALTIDDAARIAAKAALEPTPTVNSSTGIPTSPAGRARARAQLDAARAKLTPERLAAMRAQVGLPERPDRRDDGSSVEGSQGIA